MATPKKPTRSKKVTEAPDYMTRQEAFTFINRIDQDIDDLNDGIQVSKMIKLLVVVTTVISLITFGAAVVLTATIWGMISF